jgi:hypothetical protein
MLVPYTRIRRLAREKSYGWVMWVERYFIMPVYFRSVFTWM